MPLVVLGRHGVQAAVMTAWLAPRVGWGIVRSAQPWLQIARGTMLVGSSLFFIAALRWLPLADATAINYTTPILVVLLSVVLLKERMTRARWAFVAAGFVGMLLIVRPGASILHGAALLVLGAAGCYAFYQVLTRKLRGDDPLVTLFYPALCGTVMMAALLPFLDYRAAMSWLDLSLLVLFGAPATLGHFMFIRAFQRAPASALTPFTYAQLVWAVLLGWLVFGNFPDRYSLAGHGDHRRAAACCSRGTSAGRGGARCPRSRPPSTEGVSGADTIAPAGLRRPAIVRSRPHRAVAS